MQTSWYVVDMIGEAMKQRKNNWNDGSREKKDVPSSQFLFS